MSSSPRASRMVSPWSPIGPERSTWSPGRTEAGPRRSRASTSPSPAVVMYIPSALPCSTTLVSPPTTATPARRAAAAMARVSVSSTSAESPASRMSETRSATGCAPETARSFSVPFTASSPIDPPGKRSGCTTNASVVRASLVAPSWQTAASPSDSSSGPAKSGASRPSTRRRLARPPAPCAMSIWASRKRMACSSVISDLPHRRRRLPASIVVVRRAGPFGGDHERADRMLRGALPAEQLALVGLEHALQHLAALGGLGVGHPHTGKAEATLGVPLGVAVADLEGGLGNETEASPLEVWSKLEDLGHGSERGDVAFPRHHAAVLVLHLRPALLELAQDHHERLQHVERLEARGHERLPVVPADEFVRAAADHRRDVARTDERFHPHVRRIEDGSNRGDDGDVIAEHRE